MKKLIVLILIVFLGYTAYQKNVARKRDRLIGTWKMERNYQGVAVKFIMDLKPTGDVSVEVDGSYGPRIVSKDAFGNWQYTGSSFFVTFTRGEIPVYLNGKKYGGNILALDDRKLSYKSINGVETWDRIR